MTTSNEFKSSLAALFLDAAMEVRICHLDASPTSDLVGKFVDELGGYFFYNAWQTQPKIYAAAGAAIAQYRNRTMAV